MGRRREDSRKWFAVGRARWIVAFALLLCAVSTAPVLAESALPGEPSQVEEGQISFPESEDILKALAGAEKGEKEREEELSSPAAIEERETSATEYQDLTASEAEELLTDQFGEQLEDLEGDPSRFLSDAQLTRPLGEEGAAVQSEGDSQLLETTVPVRAEDESGDLHKVDLSLVREGDAFEAANPLVDLKVSASPIEGLELGSEGLGIAQMGIAESTPRQISDMDLFYPEVATDTDLLVSAIGKGVELFNQLRSADSPRTLHFAIDLPAEAELRSDQAGGAEIVNGDDLLASIPKPSAVDAQGSEVPVNLTIAQSSITLEVSPQDQEVAYPLLVDPIVENWGYENWDNGYHLDALEPGKIWWTWNEGPPNWAYHSTTYMRTKFGPSGRGLYISSPSGNLPSGFAQWQYGSYNEDSYITSAAIGNFHRYNYNCPKSQYPLPYDFDGIWGDSNWNALEFNKANDQGWTQLNMQGRVVVFGLGQGSPVSIPCWRDIAVGGIAIWLDDFHGPAITSVSGIPTGWVNDVTPFTVNVGAWDAGLGVQFVNIIPENAPVISRRLSNDCTGLSGARCPTSASENFVLNAGYFDQGIRNGSVSVLDPTGKTASGFPFQTKIDRGPPAVTLNGQLAQATNEVGSVEVPAGKGDQLSLPVYNLKIDAKDGSNASNAQKRSGVKSVEVFLDSKGTPEQTWTQTCPESSCEMTKTYVLKLHELSVGAHTLRVIASDQVGQKLERKIEFEYMPATGIDDDFVLQRFPLPDGQGNESEEENPDRPELAVNVMNGNLAYREKDVEVDGYGVNLEVDRYYNSMLPSSENTEWGDGWTLEQTPRLAPEVGGTPKTAVVTSSTSTIKGEVSLPTATGQEQFDPKLQATITKTATGYSLKDESGTTENTLDFTSAGKLDELRTDGYAKVDYAYAAGKLDEIAIKDPGSASSDIAAEASPQALAYASSFSGSGEAALKGPGDVAVDAEGNLWVIDKGNNRVEKFDAKGGYLTRFGALGSSNGQFNRPTSLAFDDSGNIWVADANNNRIQQFGPSGQFLKAFGKSGTGNGQFASPEGVAADHRGHIWVADTYNGRLQEFGEDGSFIKVVGSKGSGSGQLGEPTAVAIGPDGKVWVADWKNHRVSVFNQAGGLVREFGTFGTGDGQFRNPGGIEVDSAGNVWVSDTTNGRLQLFDQAGKYIAKFGSAGGGAGQFGFSRPAGLAAYGQGNLWIADPGNNRIQRWSHLVEENDDPSADVAISNGLVSEVSGSEVGKETYSYSGDDLVAQKGAGGETKYTYDTAGRMTKVQLPNGNYATITYNSTYGRVSSVTTVVGGVSKKTSFTYSDEPRRTEVIPPGAPVITYDIGSDGSVLKWWNAAKPPEFHDLAGSLYVERETVTPIPPGDKNLVVEGYSAEGIASVQMIANGNQVVHETTCEQDIEKLGTECVELPSEWVTNTADHPPGRLQLEVIVTDRKGDIISKRLWVNIPPPPPPLAEGTPVPPTFAEVLNFREEYGLDIVDPVENEIARNDRIFNLIGAWWAGDPVARATADRWGVPLRQQDAKELEYREWYYDVNSERAIQWVEETQPSSFAGYYIDQAAGGIMHIGFLDKQSERLASLQASLPLVAGERLQVYPVTPTTSYLSVKDASQSVSSAIESNATLADLIVSVEEGEAGEVVRVGTPAVAQVESTLNQIIGSNAPIAVEYDAGGGTLLSGRFRNEGRMRAGDATFIKHYTATTPSAHDGNKMCTAGFGAKEKGGEVGGAAIWRLFILTAGHCSSLNSVYERGVFRSTDSNFSLGSEGDWRDVGEVRRDALHHFEPVSTDAAAIRVESSGTVPQGIFGWNGSLIPTNGAGKAKIGNTVCFSGARTQIPQCGPIVARSTRWWGVDGFARGGYWVKFNEPAQPGDSGAPVWRPACNDQSNCAIGLVTAGRAYGSETLVEPLLHPPNLASKQIVGILHNKYLAPISLKLGE